MGFLISLPLIAIMVYMIYHYCGKLLTYKKGLDESKRDLEELFARRSELNAALPDLNSEHERALIQENINFLSEFHNARAREYNEFAKTRMGLMASNIINLREGFVKWLKELRKK